MLGNAFGTYLISHLNKVLLKKIAKICRAIVLKKTKHIFENVSIQNIPQSSKWNSFTKFLIQKFDEVLS